MHSTDDVDIEYKYDDLSEIMDKFIGKMVRE